MQFFRNLSLVRYFHTGRCSYALLHCHPERLREAGGRVELKDPEKYPIEAVVVPLMNASLKATTYGEHTVGLAEMYLDRDILLRNYGIAAETRLDYVEYGGRLYKLIKKDNYACYTNVEIYILQTLPVDTYDE